MSEKKNEQSDTVLVNWFERYWRRHDDCPIGFLDDGFFPYLSGSYPPGMGLRDALRAAMLAEAEEQI